MIKHVKYIIAHTKKSQMLTFFQIQEIDEKELYLTSTFS